MVFAVHSPQERKIGSIADLDPVNDFYGSLSTDYNSHPPMPKTSGVSFQLFVFFLFFSYRFSLTVQLWETIGMVKFNEYNLRSINKINNLQQKYRYHNVM